MNNDNNTTGYLAHLPYLVQSDEQGFTICCVVAVFLDWASQDLDSTQWWAVYSLITGHEIKLYRLTSFRSTICFAVVFAIPQVAIWLFVGIVHLEDTSLFQ